jgi:hypothetical protein
LAKLSEQQISQLKMLTRLPAEQLEKLRETGKISDANMASALSLNCPRKKPDTDAQLS